MKKVIKEFVSLGGKHCISNSLKQVFTYHGYPLSEEMIFGLASGLSFVYIHLAFSPMISGRTKVLAFEETLAQRLNITITCKTGKEYARIDKATKKMIDLDHPVLVYVDMAFLHYLSLGNNHFGGHAIVIFGYDDDKKVYYVSDRDNHDNSIRTPIGLVQEDYHLVSYEEMEKARSSSFKPFPANNKWLSMDFTGYQEVTSTMLKEAIMETCKVMLEVPANLVGINGIKKFSREILKWEKMDTNKLKIAGITNYFQISKDGGTGGGIFRDMYGQFLQEASIIMDSKEIYLIGESFKEVAKVWDQLADKLWQLSTTGDRNLLESMHQTLETIYTQEKAVYEKLSAIL